MTSVNAQQDAQVIDQTAQDLGGAEQVEVEIDEETRKQ